MALGTVENSTGIYGSRISLRNANTEKSKPFKHTKNTQYQL